MTKMYASFNTVTYIHSNRPIFSLAFVVMVNSWFIVYDISGCCPVICGSAAALFTDQTT
jgi:hypothetical protein